jgi:tRNA 2-selenouridine synthase
MKPNRPTVADLAAYDEIIDVRSPSEFAEDHIPGAINCPVLDDAQRIEVGTLYKQVSPFEAKKIGAALVSENIARHLKERFLDKPKTWKPLLYCWRGGDRSGSMTTIFRAIGWPAGQLDGGYKAYRGHVVERLAELPGKLQFIVIGGPTGSAKTRILQAIGRLGEQVIDLETLAMHKGSVLGTLPGQRQPSQKWFETCLLKQMDTFDPGRPVYVEAESRKIGRIHLPEGLIERIRQGQCINIEASTAARVPFLLEDYEYFISDPARLLRRLDALGNLHSRETLTDWHALIEEKNWPELVRQLLAQHYDPLYRRSQDRNFVGQAEAAVFVTDDLSTAGIERLAADIVQARTAQMA